MKNVVSNLKPLIKIIFTLLFKFKINVRFYKSLYYALYINFIGK